MQGLNHVKSKHNLRLRLLDRMFAFHGVVVGFPVANYHLSFCISFLFIVGTTTEVSLVSLETETWQSAFVEAASATPSGQ